MYQSEYDRKLTDPTAAAASIAENASLIHGLAMAEPPGLLTALAERLRSGDLKKLQVHVLLPNPTSLQTILAPDLVDQVEAITWFVSGGERGLVRTGLNYFVPNHFHQVPRLIRDYLDLDVVMTTVSPMDKAGYFSFGTANDFTTTAARRAKKLIVEVNRNMPRVFGESLLHISEVDVVVENHRPLAEMVIGPVGPEDEIIGRTISEMVPDGACLQLGWGALPSSAAKYLADHRDLGVHTEVFVPAFVDLIHKGVITGARKNFHQRKHVFTVAQGNQEMLDFMDDNPAMESYPVSYCNRPEVIARNDNMISINSILQVDLTGQCNSEYLAGHQFSGTGGQLDYVRGAYDAKGGKSILAFHSTAKKGTVSRITPRLEAGAAVTTPRQDVHWLVTEHGKAELKGKDTRQRALAIIELADPKFREELMRAAEDMYLL